MAQEDKAAAKTSAQILTLCDRQNELIPIESLSLTRLHFSSIQAASSKLWT